MTDNKDITIPEAQQMVDHWIKTIGVRYFSELTNMAILTEEVGELARIMARTYGDQSFKKSDEGKNLGDEMADVLWVLICLANQTGVDLTDAFTRKYIFPGGYIPALSETVAASEKYRLIASDIETLRLHYALTLRDWCANRACWLAACPLIRIR